MLVSQVNAITNLLGSNSEMAECIAVMSLLFIYGVGILCISGLGVWVADKLNLIKD